MTERGNVTRILWTLHWLAWLILLGLQIFNQARFGAPWPLWVVLALPLVIFAPAMSRDNSRGMIWYCFVLLFYFIRIVEFVFAQPADGIARALLLSVVSSFLLTVLYIRFRGRERRATTKPT